MAVFCERTAADPGLLARPDVQKLTPYQSARRIMQAAGVTGEVWLNANESARDEALQPLSRAPARGRRRTLCGLCGRES